MEEKNKPELITRIQNRRGKTIFKKKALSAGCDKFINKGIELPKIEIVNEKAGEETAYQMTSILQGTVERGTAKKLRS